MQVSYEPGHSISHKIDVRQTMTQISLRICAGWSESLFLRSVGSPTSKLSSDRQQRIWLGCVDAQTDLSPHAGCTISLAGILCPGSVALFLICALIKSFAYLIFIAACLFVSRSMQLRFFGSCWKSRLYNFSFFSDRLMKVPFFQALISMCLRKKNKATQTFF